MAKNVLFIFISKLLEFPLWVKQIIYLDLYKDLSSFLSEDFVQAREEHIFQIHIPVLSFLGRTELAEKKGQFDENIYNFLINVSNGLNILEISMNNFWTMEEVAKYYIFCLEQNFIKVPESVEIPAMAGFMAGKYRTGEYFKRTGKINVDQLEHTLIKQKEYSEKGTPLKMAEVMISLGYINKKDSSSLLVIKEESKKRFILDSSIVPKEVSHQLTSMPSDEVLHYKEEIAKLTEQNKKLKEQLSKILEYVKKNG